MAAAISHPVVQTIRNRTKINKSGGEKNGYSSNETNTSQNNKKDMIKVVLGNPLTVGWPNIPHHLQTAIVSALPQLLTSEVADYHLCRSRCSRSAKRSRRRELRARSALDVLIDESLQNSDVNEDSPQNITAPVAARPPVLDHLVIGLNETLKTLERSIEDLRLNLTQIAESLQSRQQVSMRSLLPTAPVAAGTPDAESHRPLSSPPLSPISFIVVSHLSVSPSALIDPIPNYCATYNSILHQYGQLHKAARSRLPGFQQQLEMPSEICVVPLGRREAEISALIGLRRVSCFAVRSSHPNIQLLHTLLPKSVLRPPRYLITLPTPAAGLTIYAKSEHGPQDVPIEKPSKVFIPFTTTTFNPIHIKGVQTTVPADNGTRKNIRLAEVRRRRIESKTKRVNSRRKLEAKVQEDIKTGKKRHLKGGVRREAVV